MRARVIIQMILDKEKGTLKDIRTRAFISFGMGVFATIGCAINLFVLPKFYHFDDSGSDAKQIMRRSISD